MRPFNAILLAVAVGVSPMLSARSVACGVELELPSNHFDGVNELGELSFWEKVGEIKLEDDLRLPININFRSGRETTSRYLGKGWLLAPLDSNIVQLEENRFMMLQPNGSWIYFTRRNPTDTILHGQGSWKAEIKADTITAWANCRDKLVFSKGKLTTIFVKNRTLDLIYSGDQVSEIREGGNTLLRVDIDSITGNVVGLSVGKNKISFELGEKPKVEVIAGKRVVAGIEKSLTKLKLGLGFEQVIDYALDDTLEPTIKITGDGQTRTMKWDPMTRFISMDGDWKYQIDPGATRYVNAAITRKTADGRREYWFKNLASGKEIYTLPNGAERTKAWFTSGALAGRIREVSDSNGRSNGAKSVVYKAYFDEKGNILRFKQQQPDGGAFEVSLTNSAAGNVVGQLSNQNGQAAATVHTSGGKVSGISFP